MEYYSIDEEKSLYDELPLIDYNGREPRRSRMQIDMSKDARIKLRQIARRQNTNIKGLVLTTLQNSYPELDLEREIRLGMYRNTQPMLSEREPKEIDNA